MGVARLPLVYPLVICQILAHIATQVSHIAPGLAVC